MQLQLVSHPEQSTVNLCLICHLRNKKLTTTCPKYFRMSQMLSGFLFNVFEKDPRKKPHRNRLQECLLKCFSPKDFKQASLYISCFTVLFAGSELHQTTMIVKLCLVPPQQKNLLSSTFAFCLSENSSRCWNRVLQTAQGSDLSQSRLF